MAKTSFLIAALASTTWCSAQAHTSLFVHNPEGDVPIPVSSTEVVGTKDSVAIAELAAHRAANGGLPWAGMQGTGTLTASRKDTPALQATYLNLGADKFRLDIQEPKGVASTRLDRLQGATKNSAGLLSSLPFDLAIAGIFPFELPRSSVRANKSLSIHDYGMVSLGGTELHRISMERLTLGSDPVTKQRNTIVIDYYFDPNSHQLIKSAVMVPATGSRHVMLLSVVTYSDFRTVSGSIVPFCFSETLQGKPHRTLQLSDVQLAPASDSTSFTF